MSAEIQSGVPVGLAAAPEPRPASEVDPATPSMLMPLAMLLVRVNHAMVAFGMVALLAASAVLTSSVVTRYLFKSSTDWQDETAVFLLVGATFLCGAFVQSIRGHIGIEAVSSLLPSTLDRVRLLLVDVLSLCFCALFAWKSWTLLHEAWVEGYYSATSWAPPLWIPYGLMALGITLVSLQFVVQAAASFNAIARPPAGTGR